LLDALAAQRIGVILLKGVGLIERVYENIALRPMVDVDILVRKTDVRRALAALQAGGYQTTGPEIAPETTLEYENEIMLWKRDRLDWVLELHWSLFDSPFYQNRLPEDALWRAAVPVTLDGVPARILSHENELLHLCGHLALHHRGTGLLWWNDIAEFITVYHDSLDWDMLISQAADLDLLLPLQTILPIAAGQWAAPIPGSIIEQLAGHSPKPAEIRVFEQLTADRRPPVQRLLDDLHGLPDRGEQLRFLWRNVFPSGEYMDERYGIRHPALRPIYYFLRWVNGAGEMLRKA
jgi:hypothetical protein